MRRKSHLRKSRYTAASFGCVASAEISRLIAILILQAIGGSGAFSAATAMVKEIYESKRRDQTDNKEVKDRRDK